MSGEIIRDAVAVVAIIITLPYIALSSPADITEGVAIFLWGQVAASAVTWVVLLIIGARLSWRTPWHVLTDSIPYALLSLLAVIAMLLVKPLFDQPLAILACEAVTGIGIYLLINHLCDSKIQRDVIGYILGRWRQQKC